MRRAIKIHDQTKYKEFLEHSKAQHSCTPILVLVLRSSLSMRLLDLHVTIDFISFWSDCAATIDPLVSPKFISFSWIPSVLVSTGETFRKPVLRATPSHERQSLPHRSASLAKAYQLSRLHIFP